MHAPSNNPSATRLPARVLLGATLLALAAAGCDESEIFPDDLDTAREVTFDPATGDDAGPTEPEGNPDFFCPYRHTPQPQDPTAMPLPFPYCATASLDRDTRYDFHAVTRLVISQHGRGSNAHMYFNRITNAANALATELNGPTFVIAPQFFDLNPINDNEIDEWELDGLLWWKNGHWPNGLLSNGHAGEQFSAYTILDELVDKAVQQMPNLEEIIFVGQSAGGQTVQKYAVLSDAEYPPGVSVRYVPANPFAYAYVDEQRSTFEFGQQSPYDHAFVTPGANDPFPWQSPLVCPDLVGTPRPDDYDDWAGGLENAPSYSGDLDQGQQAQVRDRYLDRNVTYLIGENDMFTDGNQCGGNTQVQGKHRRRRAEAYAAHVQQLGAEHQLVKVPDFGHGSTMFDEDCVRRVIFGLGEDCAAMEDHAALAHWSGEIVAVTAFESRDGDSVPELVVAHRSGNDDRLYLLDDEASGFAFLADITPPWGAGAKVTGLGVEYMSPDAIGRELVVGVSGGNGGWYLLGPDNGGAVQLESGGQGQDVADLAIANLSPHLGHEFIVAWDTDQGERWRAFGWNGASHVPTSSGTYAGSARPVAIEVQNFVYDDAFEIALALDSSTGPRIALADTLGNSMLVDPGWPDGQRIVDAESSWRLGIDGKSTRELVLATTGGDRPWVVLEEDPGSPGMLLQVLESPEAWPPGVEPTSISVDVPFAGKSTVALGRTGPVDGHAVLYTYKREDVDEENVAVLGDVRVDALGLSEDAEIPAIEFADLDRHGTDELIIGRGGDADFGYRLRVLSAL